MKPPRLLAALPLAVEGLSPSDAADLIASRLTALFRRRVFVRYRTWSQMGDR